MVFKQIQQQSMEQSKSPKSCAYARLGKHLSGKHSVPEENLKINRNSTGNIYEEILRQFDTDQGKYIRELVHKNQKAENQSTTTGAYHNRRKSYADLMVEPPKEKEKLEPQRQQRQTLCKPKYPKENVYLQQMTPKNNTAMTRSDFIKPTNNSYQSVKVSGFIKRQNLDQKEDKNFIDSLNEYLQNLNEAVEQTKPYHNEKLGQTMKIPHNQESHTLASKLQQSLIKIKQLKLKNHFMQKQLNKFSKRQRKMKECLNEMLEQIKQTSSQLTREKRQRRRLEKIIETYEMQGNKLERKTIGKGTLSKIEQFQRKINQFSQNQERSDVESSFRDVWKHSTNGRQPKGPSPFNHDRQHSYMHRGILDSNKIDELFKSKYHSEDQDSYE